MKRAAPATVDNNNPKSQKSSNKAKKEDRISDDDLFCAAMGVFKEKLEYLDWKDAVAFGAVNRECRKVYLEKRDTMIDFQPLLTVLEGLVGSNKHHYCGAVYAPVSRRNCSCALMFDTDDDRHPDNQAVAQLDPRYKETYDALSTYEKCVKMVHYLTPIVSNMRGQFRFDDFANPDKMPNVVGRVSDWSRGVGVHTRYLLSYPRRVAFAFNVALLAHATTAMKCKNYYHHFFFNNFFLGNGDDMGLMRNLFERSMTEIVAGMVHFRDKDLFKRLKTIYPSTTTLAILGPALVSKVILCAPAFAIVPSSTKHYNDEGVQLPTGLEKWEGIAL